MVVNSPREFPLTRENVILIRQSHHFQISNLLPQIFCHLIIARPGNENLVALQPTVSGIFETFVIFFSGDLRGSIGGLCLSWRPSLFVSRGFKMQSQAFKMFHFFQERELSSYDGYTRGRWDWNCKIREFFLCRCLLECKNTFAAQQNNTGCLPWWEQSSKICANAIF